MDREKIKKVREVLNKVIKANHKVFEDVGVSAEVAANANYSEIGGSFKIEISDIAEDGTVVSKIAEDYKIYAESYGMKKEWLGKEFKSRGKTFTLLGFKTRARKMPIVAADNTGARYKMTTDAVIAAHTYSMEDV